MNRAFLIHAPLLTLTLFHVSNAFAGEPMVLNIWPSKPPGETQDLPPESDKTKPTDRLIAGKRIIKLGNVSTPQIAVYKPSSELDCGASVVICPGGGHHILAYDLEGTEVAEWLNTIGVTGIVLKYRVPFRDPQRRWSAAVQDAQRAMSLVRSRASEWGLDPERIGICGFSAGGQTAALTSIFDDDRQYRPIDAVDNHSSRPNFAVLIYPAGIVESNDNPKLQSHLRITENTPPMFLVHAFDDRVTAQHSLVLASELKRAGIPAELHLFETGGHGYGLRITDASVTKWPRLAEKWMAGHGITARK